jgi:hypothetical protein
MPDPNTHQTASGTSGAPSGTHQRHPRGKCYPPRVRYSEAVFVETTLVGPGPAQTPIAGADLHPAHDDQTVGGVRPVTTLPGRPVAL